MYTSIYNPYVPQEVFLEHHGIMGQRWGKKNGPPYPLSAGAHSASEKKAGWRKSLAGGAKAVGRGTVKVAKAVGKGTVATAKFANKAAIRMGVKPKRLMTDEEIEHAYNRLKQEANYKRALKGKFIDVTEAQRKKGDGLFKKTLQAIGDTVIVPAISGGVRYLIAEKLNGSHAEGEKVISKIETIFNKERGIGYRNNYFYDPYGNVTFRSGGKKGGDGGDGGGGGKKKKTQQPQQTPNEAPEESTKKKDKWHDVIMFPDSNKKSTYNKAISQAMSIRMEDVGYEFNGTDKEALKETFKKARKR